METSDPALKEVVNSMPAWASADRVEAEYISGGITNRNYCVRVDGEPFFVRLAGEETEVLGIDRDNERSAVEAAAAAGMGPGVVAFLPEHGCLITEWIEGAPVPPEDLQQRTMLDRLVRSIRAFHSCQKIPGTFSPSGWWSSIGNPQRAEASRCRRFIGGSWSGHEKSRRHSNRNRRPSVHATTICSTPTSCSAAAG